jgi:hypothetical protein
MTWWPSAASADTIARPMPPVAPVTSPRALPVRVQESPKDDHFDYCGSCRSATSWSSAKSRWRSAARSAGFRSACAMLVVSRLLCDLVDYVFCVFEACTWIQVPVALDRFDLPVLPDQVDDFRRDGIRIRAGFGEIV